MGLNDELKAALNIDKNKMSVKLTEAPNIKKKEYSTYAVPTKFSVVQADLIYVKEESKGYKYILTVVDVSSRKMDAVPLKGRTNEDVIEGFELIWKRKHLDKSKVKHIITDPGSEFKNANFHDYMEDLGIIVRHTMTARKTQTGIVEYYNGIIMKNLGIKMTSEELEHDHDYSDWADDLNKIVEVLNQKKYEKDSKISDFVGQPKVGKNEKLLEVGTIVHVRLQQPINHRVDNKKERLHGGFRAGDLRWEKETTKVELVVINPKQPIRYMVEKYKNVSFLRKELLVNSDPIPQPQIDIKTKSKTKKGKVKDIPIKNQEENINVENENNEEIPEESVFDRTRSKKNSKYPNMV
jgi:hypothetical protein